MLQLLIGKDYDFKESIKFHNDERVKEEHKYLLIVYSMKPIVYAAFSGKFEALKVLVESGCDINSHGVVNWNKNYIWETNIIGIAVSQGNIDCVMYILEKMNPSGINHKCTRTENPYK